MGSRHPRAQPSFCNYRRVLITNTSQKDTGALGEAPPSLPLHGLPMDPQARSSPNAGSSGAEWGPRRARPVGLRLKQGAEAISGSSALHSWLHQAVPPLPPATATLGRLRGSASPEGGAVAVTTHPDSVLPTGPGHRGPTEPRMGGNVQRHRTS